MSKLEEMKRDPRSTAELVETALSEQELDEDHWFEHSDQLSALVVLQARGTAEVLEAARMLCRSPDSKRRALAATVLGELGSPERTFPEECCDALVGLLRTDKDEHVLMSAVFAFGHLGARGGDLDIIALKDHPKEAIRHGVAFALAGATSPEAVRTLLELMEDSYEPARDWATTNIGEYEEIDGPEIRDALWRRTGDESEFVRAEALNGLARRGDEAVLPPLIAEMSREDDNSGRLDNAAKAILHLDEERSFSTEELLAALKQRAAKN